MIQHKLNQANLFLLILGEGSCINLEFQLNKVIDRLLLI